MYYPLFSYWTGDTFLKFYQYPRISSSLALMRRFKQIGERGFHINRRNTGCRIDRGDGWNQQKTDFEVGNKFIFMNKYTVKIYMA